jgi:hypothetical protein
MSVTLDVSRHKASDIHTSEELNTVSYTAVEVTMTSTPLVAIYVEDGKFEAERVLGVAMFRNPDDRNSPNVLVPIHGDDLGVHQNHDYLNRRELNSRLPQQVLCDRLLWDGLEGSSSAIVKIDSTTGLWVRA